MREIKFRAWDSVEKRIRQWDELRAHPNDVASLFDYSALTQYTGLKDKNGKEIYEGDVIECPPLFKGDKPYFEVLFGECRVAGLNHWGWLSRSAISTSMLDQSIVENGEVIGNIYENPELLK